MQDSDYMQLALTLARKGQFTTSPNPCVGCVIVKNGRVVGQGYHKRAGESHAEVYALYEASHSAKSATAYITLEPCSHHGRTPPCAEALIKSGISRVVIAMEDPNPHVKGKGIAMLKAAGIEVDVGLLATEAQALNKGFVKRMLTQQPYVQLKLAASLDGRTALANGKSKWITGTEARQDVQQFRAQSCAILTTAATVMADNPSLTVRHSELPLTIQHQYKPETIRQPLRVVIDSQTCLNNNYQIINDAFQTLLISGRSYKEHFLTSVTSLIQPLIGHHISLLALLNTLGQQQINTVWVEAGSHLAGALITAQLIDELIVYLAPKLLGQHGRPLAQLPELLGLDEAPQFNLCSVKQVGEDVRLIFTPSK